MEKSLSAHHRSDVRDGGGNKKQARGFPAACLEPVVVLISKAGEINSAQRWKPHSGQVRFILLRVEVNGREEGGNKSVPRRKAQCENLHGV